MLFDNLLSLLISSKNKVAKKKASISTYILFFIVDGKAKISTKCLERWAQNNFMNMLKRLLTDASLFLRYLELKRSLRKMMYFLQLLHPRDVDFVEKPVMEDKSTQWEEDHVSQTQKSLQQHHFFYIFTIFSCSFIIFTLFLIH